MMIAQDISLKDHNTFGLNAIASFYCEVGTVEALAEALGYAQKHSLSIFILGGGSNVILPDELHTLVIAIRLKGISYAGDQVTVMAGENWHQFVRRMIEEKRYGLENLSYIPGLVGAAPVQNIGAYGLELADRFVSLEAMDRSSGEVLRLSKEDCQFGYRDSLFKHALKDRVVITSITLRLEAEFTPFLEYPDLQNAFKNQAQLPDAKMLSDTIIDIRSRKLPDPNKVGNAGSFFKNPVLSKERLEGLQEKYPKLNGIEQSDGSYKLSAAFLINLAGLKGYSIGGASVSTQHVLVLINEGSASANDVISLAKHIQAAVKHRFDLSLEIEPAIIA